MQKSTPGFSKGALKSARFHLDFSLIALCRWADTAVLAPFKKAFSHAAQEWYRPKHRDTLAAQCASLWIRHKTGSVSLIAIACSIALLWVLSPLVIVLLTVVAAKVLPLEWLHVDLTRFYHYLGR